METIWDDEFGDGVRSSCRALARRKNEKSKCQSKECETNWGIDFIQKFTHFPWEHPLSFRARHEPRNLIYHLDVFDFLYSHNTLLVFRLYTLIAF